MIIRDMFAENINRPINGVIKVDQDTGDVIEQEVKEYVITRELKKHFTSFFHYYSDAFDTPAADTGVWISGFFGSGKSHFLKMLSYLLENKRVGGVPTAELFREKFSDDPETFALIDRAAHSTTESILFNIDIESSINKDKTAVLRVFAKMFYNHLGFYGENLKVAMLEQYIEQLGKTEEFRSAFEQKKGKPWTEQRKAFAFNGKFIIPTLMEVLDMSEEDAKNWFHDKTAVEFSIAHLVEDIKEYISSKPDDFRLLFMVDEVGQYVGTDTDMLLNLQSLTEKIGSECGGKVWIICTGQEAIDEIIKVRADEFSRIQARFKTRLSLSSSSVDEVIQKRILKKKPEVETRLEALYTQNDSVLRNLFTFTNAVSDMMGYTGPDEFAVNFPFVPYQFIIMQKVFAEIRKHGNSGKHLSGGERSMLSGFQEAAQKIQQQDEYALVPFFRFYDTVHTFLDGSIRRVIERCQRAADGGLGIEPQDVDILKLLYLIRYVDDIPANIDNIVVLMADDIRTDKIILREKAEKSLHRLLSQNYIGHAGDVFHFLTDEEQDVQREIRNTNVDTSTIVERIAQMIFADIYTTKKFRFRIYDFDFDKMVDGVTIGSVTGGMKLRFLTVATDAVEKSELRLMTESKGQAIVVLADSPYYEHLETAAKVHKYVKQKNVLQLPRSVQDIIRVQQNEAGKLEKDAMEHLKRAIESAGYYVDGEHLEIKSGDAKSRIDQALEYLVEHVYSELNLIDKNAVTDADVISILNGTGDIVLDDANVEAAARMEEYLTVQARMKLPTSMADVQSRYQAIPYGWREIDVAAVAAKLIYEQKVTVKYCGATIRADNPKLPDMLRKKSETGKTSIALHQAIPPGKLRAVKDMLRDYFDVMDVPDDENGLAAFIIKKFTEKREHYRALHARYDASARQYPGRTGVARALQLINDVLSQQADNIALIDRLLSCETALLDNKDDMQEVEGFFQNQVQIFDAAAQMEEDLRNELDYLSHEPEANEALNKIRLITVVKGGFSYGKIPELNGPMKTVREGHDRLLSAKREELTDIVQQCLAAVHQAADGCTGAGSIVTKADAYYVQKREQIAGYTSLALLDGLVPPMLQFMDRTCASIEALKRPPEPKKEPPTPDDNNTAAPPPKKIIKAYQRGIVFPAKKLESEEEIDAYVEQMRRQLKQLLSGCDGIQLK